MRFSVWDAPCPTSLSEVQDNRTGHVVVRALPIDAALIAGTLNAEGLTQVFGELSVTRSAATALDITSARYQWEADVVIYGPDWTPDLIHRRSQS